MNFHKYLIIFGALLSSCAHANLVETVDGLKVKEGFQMSVFAEGVGKARHIVVKDNGDVYVHLKETRNDGAIVALRDSDVNGSADKIEYFEDEIGTGLELYDGHLYFSSDSAVYRRAFLDDELVPMGERQVIVKNFPQQKEHAAKAFTISPKGELYVNVGAPSNSCQIQNRETGSFGMEPCPLLVNHAGIWSFSAKKTNQDFKKDGVHFASGLRNIVALAWNKAVGKLFVVQHGRDSLHDLFPDIYTEKQSAELPAEEFLALEKGYQGSWPYAYWDHFRKEHVISPEYGGNGDRISVEFKKPLYGFPAHYAPNDLIFYEGQQLRQRYHGGAFVAFHGSWNRLGFSQEGYQVSFLPMKDGVPSSESEVFVTGFAGQQHISQPDEAQYRAMGVAQGSDGSLYIVDSVKGRIWKVIDQN